MNVPIPGMDEWTSNLKVLIPLGLDERQARMALARQHGLGLEVTAFLSGPPLNDSVLREKTERELAKDLRGFAGATTLHGAFRDLAPHSEDDAIAALSRLRIERDLATAIRLGCRKVVFHLGFNPLIGGRRHRADFITRHAVFWKAMLLLHPGVEICLENQWEPDWMIFEELFGLIDHRRIGLCLDVAHAHVHSHFAPEAWIKEMGSHILHLHWSDNHGDRDRHASLGAGNIDWPSIFDAGSPCDTVTLEMNSLSALRRSLRFLDQEGFRRATAHPPSLTGAEPLVIAS